MYAVKFLARLVLQLGDVRSSFGEGVAMLEFTLAEAGEAKPTATK
jgi:hypothetical protein